MNPTNYIANVRSRSLVRFFIGLLVRLRSRFVINLRLSRMRRQGAVIGCSSVVGQTAKFSGFKNLRIGEHCSIQGGFFDTRAPISIKDNVIVGAEVSILTCTHDIDTSEWTFRTFGVEIDDYVWIATGAKILPQCRRIGRGAVIGAYAVVSRDVPPMAVVVGNPARVLRYRKCVHEAIVPEAFQGGDLRMYLNSRFRH